MTSRSIVLAAAATLVLAGGGVAGAAELTVLWNINSDKEQPVLEELFAEYTKAHPETTFKLQIVNYDDYDQKLAQLAAAGTAPDIAKSTSMRPVIRPFLVDFAPAFGKDYLEQFVPSWAFGAKLGEKAIAAPLDVTATGIFLNVDAFKKAGVAIPNEDEGWTWEKFLPTIKEVAQKSGVRFPLVWDVSASRFIVYPYQHGVHVYSEAEPYKVVLDKAKATKVLEDFIKITDTYMPPGLWSGSSADNPKQLFLTGQAVAWMSGSWQVGALTSDAKLTWQVGPTPHASVRSSIVGGDYLIAFNTAGHVDEATEVVRWFSTPEVQAKFCGPLMYIPAHLKAGPVDYGNPLASAAMSTFQAELAASPLYAGTDQGNQAMQYVWDPLKQSVIQAVTRQLTPAQAIDKITQAAEESLQASP
jgi:alpha-1,4-digalacturonate transport system substrate-binding protein